MSEIQQLPLSVQPAISYPHEAQVSKTYLMTIDLQSSGDGEWLYEEEEYPIYCMLDTAPLFTSKPVGEPAVVLHRFGGSYGAAKFLLTAAQEEMEGEIRLTLVNGWGVPIKVINLNDVKIGLSDDKHKNKANIQSVEAAKLDRNKKQNNADFLVNQFIKETGFPPKSISIPYRGVTNFVGRQQERVVLHQRLQQPGIVAISAIAGMGGVGKTELAIRYARQYEADYPGGILWLNARESDLAAEVVQFAALSMKLEVPQKDCFGRQLTLKEKVDWCWQNWQPPDGLVLVVLNDVTDLASCQEALPTDNRFRVLMTTRLRNLDSNIQDLPLDVLSPDEAISLLTALIGEQRVQKELQTVEELCKWLGYLPLGLGLVGRYLSKKPPNWSVAKTLQQLKAQRIEDEALNPQLQKSLSTAQRGVKAAFELSWEELSPTTQLVSGLLSLFALDIFLWSWVESIAQELDWIESEVVSANEQLYQHHLIQSVEEIDGGYRIHPLIREFLQAKQVALATHSPSQVEQSLKQVQIEGSRSIKQVFAAFFREVAEKVPDSLTLRDIESVKLAIPHLGEVAQSLDDVLEGEESAGIFSSLINFYQTQGLYVLAEGWCEQYLSAMKARFGENHPDVATCLNNLASLYRDTGRYGEAEPLLVQALEMHKRLLGENHPSVATSLNSLARLYRKTGRYDEAEPLLVQALELSKRLLGENHPSIATSLGNLATLYSDTGRYDKAEPLLVQALELSKRLLGENHPSIATSLNNLAGIYRATGRYDEAEPLYIQALEIYKQRLGDAHPYTLKVRQNLEMLRAITASSNQTLDTTALAVGSVIATKALEKTGEKVGEVLIDKISKFIESLREQSSNTVTVIERALEEPLHYGEAVIQVGSVAQANPEVNQAMLELAAAAKADPKVASTVQKLETNLSYQPGAVTNHTKLAEIIKNVFQGI